MEIIKVFISPPLDKTIYIYRSDEVQTREYGRRMGGYSSSY